MKKLFLKPVVYGVTMIAALSLGACSEDSNGSDDLGTIPGDSTGIFEGTLISENIVSDVTLEAGKTYTLRGGVHVKAPATLTIEPGVKIVAEDLGTSLVTYILIEQGAKINAQGTAEKPIVMTCELEEDGDLLLP